MSLYITQAQSQNMRVKHCRACLKIRSITFWQPSPILPVVLTTDEDRTGAPVKIREFCTCPPVQETPQAQEKGRTSER